MKRLYNDCHNTSLSSFPAHSDCIDLKKALERANYTIDIFQRSVKGQKEENIRHKTNIKNFYSINKKNSNWNKKRKNNVKVQ